MKESSAAYLIRITTGGRMESIPVSETKVSQTVLADLLQTDVTERMRLSVMPDGMPEEQVLCYFIDARGGERELPVNFLGTCFYHTGCPIYGDLLIALCQADCETDTVYSFSPEQYDTVQAWLLEQYSAYMQ
ncbi:MAG: hypothetical protein MJ071_04115 [Oscillospiraceae bacterium]|nr:hypothetical protein [Oscillospiraceae bacterium]